MSILKKSNEEKTNDDSRLLNISLDIFDDAFVGLTKDFKISLWSKGAEKRLGYLVIQHFTCFRSFSFQAN